MENADRVPTDDQRPRLHLGVDIGGTFTDLVLYDEAARRILGVAQDDVVRLRVLPRTLDGAGVGGSPPPGAAGRLGTLSAW